MNLPNLLTIGRLFLTVGFIYSITKRGGFFYLLAIVLFVLAVLSDYLDGYFARKYNLFTDFGKIMDPVADKFLVLSAFFVFMRQGYFPSWMFYLIAGRELLVTMSRFSLMRKGRVIAAERAGKAKTVLQMVTIFSMLGMNFLLNSTSDPSAWVFQQGTMAYGFFGIQLLMVFTVTLTLYSGIKYFWNNRQDFF